MLSFFLLAMLMLKTLCTISPFNISQIVDSTSIYNGVTITGVNIINNGKIAYVGMTESGTEKLKKYDLSTGTALLLGEYILDNGDSMDNIFIF